MMISAPIERAMSIGRLRTKPPSTSWRRPISTGATAPGTDIDARIACTTLPSFSTTISPVPMSVAIARNGIGSSSKLRALVTCTSRRNSPSSATPVTSPFGSSTPSAVTASSGTKYGRRSSSLRRIVWSCRGGLSVNRRSVVIVLITFSISSTERPVAYAAPTIEPMLVPTIRSIGTCSSSRTFRTPI